LVRPVLRRAAGNKMNIPFTKAHGARNDFLLTWREQLPSSFDPVSAAVAICDRHTGVGADGWLLISPSESADGAIELWNSGRQPLRDFGQRDALRRRFLIEANRASENVRGPDRRRPETPPFARSRRPSILFRNEYGLRCYRAASRHDPRLRRDHSQCRQPSMRGFCGSLRLCWRALGAEIERHWQFPNRTNVSFIKTIDEHTLDVRFFERGAGETMSSGTGSTGAAAAAFARGLVQASRPRADAGGSTRYTMGRSGHPSRRTRGDCGVRRILLGCLSIRGILTHSAQLRQKIETRKARTGVVGLATSACPWPWNWRTLDFPLPASTSTRGKWTA